MGKRKVLRTKLCDMLGIEYPILLAGMGGLAGMGACSKPKFVAALALGAIGVWIGTAFLFTHEANVPELHRKMMLEATEEDTRVSRIYTGKTLRAVKNPLIEAGEKSGVPPPSYAIAAPACYGFDSGPYRG